MHFAVFFEEQHHYITDAYVKLPGYIWISVVSHKESKSFTIFFFYIYLIAFPALLR